MYAQVNYPNLFLGSTGLPVSKYGCLGIDWVNALNFAGYQTTPEDFFSNMNANGGFDANGDLIWEVIPTLYPQVQLDQDGYTFQQGNWGSHEHWLLIHDGITYDPWLGLAGTPNPFTPTNSRNASIAPFQAPVEPQAPVESTPAEPTPTAVPETPTEPTPAPEVTPAPFQYTVVEGDTLGQIILSHYGDVELWGEGGKVAEIAAFNGIADPNVISVGQVIQLP